MKFRLIFKAMIAILPSFLKRSIYRHVFGYTIGKNVFIGLSVIDVQDCQIDDGVSIGHFNVFISTKKLSIGELTRIGHFNIFRGGDLISIGRYCEILRFNEINSIPDPVASNQVDPTLIIGNGCMISSSHKIDFTDRVEFGRRVILGGRNSSIWTHNRQETQPIKIGELCYIGSEIRMAPGSSIPDRCIVGIGSVITKKLEAKPSLIGGVPAKVIKLLDDESLVLIETKTRIDLPDDI